MPRPYVKIYFCISVYNRFHSSALPEIQNCRKQPPGKIRWPHKRRNGKICDHDRQNNPHFMQWRGIFRPHVVGKTWAYPCKAIRKTRSAWLFTTISFLFHSLWVCRHSVWEKCDRGRVCKGLGQIRSSKSLKDHSSSWDSVIMGAMRQYNLCSRFKMRFNYLINLLVSLYTVMLLLAAS